MDRIEWAATVAATIAAEIKKQRASQGLSAEALSERCSDLGFPISRQIIAKVESGHRGALDVPELLVLADALQVPPVALIFPPDREAFVRTAPLVKKPVWDAAKWFCGEEDPVHPPEDGSTRATLDALRRHDRLLRIALMSHRISTERRQEAQLASPADYEAINRAAAQLEAVAQQDRSELLAARQALRARGVFPSPLPDSLAFIDPVTT
ncbi:helix-turn-helix domain-containing protein [Kitasatospora indigofera]|uniref:helix-turn-helix domain-containing protein n=1 Tax=Kitasatospora indigofera TaxID=67307 RepID=UPI0036396173